MGGGKNKHGTELDNEQSAGEEQREMGCDLSQTWTWTPHQINALLNPTATFARVITHSHTHSCGRMMFFLAAFRVLTHGPGVHSLQSKRCSYPALNLTRRAFKVVSNALQVIRHWSALTQTSGSISCLRSSLSPGNRSKMPFKQLAMRNKARLQNNRPSRRRLYANLQPLTSYLLQDAVK